MATKQQITILTKLKERLSYALTYDQIKDGFIWIGAQNGLIGNLTSHYEFIFQDDETLNLEVHFEDKNCTKFENVLSENDKKTLEFTNWGKKYQHRRIIGRDYNYCIKIGDYNNVDEIVNSAIKLLEELDKEIGTRLAECISQLNIQNDLSGDGTIVSEREYKNRYVCYPKNYSSKHGQIQQALVKKLASKYDEVGFERALCDIRVDVLGINKNGKRDKRKYSYDIYEVKPYDSPTECIREALGQLLYYKYQFEKNGYKVGSLIVVGQNELEFYDRQYLEIIQKFFPIDYITPY